MRKAIVEKQKKVEELKGKLKQARTVMIVNIEGIPADLLQKIRREVKDRAFFRVYKNVIITRALEGSNREELKKLLPYVEGHPSAIIITDEDPIVFYREVSRLEEYLPLKPGKVSPVDVVLEPGPVPVPVTALADLKSAGIPVKSVKGKVELAEEFVAVRAGEVVSENIAKALELMGIKPVRAYLKIIAAVSDGILFPEDVLTIKPEDVLEDLKRAATNAFNLAYNARYPTKETVPFFLVEAHQRALNLAVNAGILTKETAVAVLSKAHAQALALAARLPTEVVGKEIVVQTAEKPQEEEKKEEEKEEKKEETEDAAAGLASLFG